MALIQVNYLSKSLFRTVPLNVILPADKLDFASLSYAMKDGQKFKTLYLLHGLLGNYTDWLPLDEGASGLSSGHVKIENDSL